MQLMQGDCLRLLNDIEDGSIDMVLADVPYGNTACKWDAVIPFGPLWWHLERIAKDDAAIVLTASQPFSASLIGSNFALFKYALVWEKSRTGGFWDCKYRPLKSHEDVCVFSKGGVANGSKTKMKYYPQGIEASGKEWTAKPVSGNSRTGSGKKGKREAKNYPRSVLRFDSVTKPVHPTQKPVDLMEYLIRTHTQPGEVVLDFTMGSGTTGVACKNTGRHFIGIELDEEYFRLAQERIRAA